MSHRQPGAGAGAKIKSVVTELSSRRHMASLECGVIKTERHSLHWFHQTQLIQLHGVDTYMPPAATIENQILTFMLRTFPTARKLGLRNDTLLLEGGIVDSLGTLNIVSFLERSFNITIHDDDLVPENFATLDTLTAFAKKKIECPGTASL